jgi:hypothetical protein
MEPDRISGYIARPSGSHAPAAPRPVMVALVVTTIPTGGWWCGNLDLNPPVLEGEAGVADDHCVQSDRQGQESADQDCIGKQGSRARRWSLLIFHCHGSLVMLWWRLDSAGHYKARFVNRFDPGTYTAGEYRAKPASLLGREFACVFPAGSPGCWGPGKAGHRAAENMPRMRLKTTGLDI